MATKHIFYLPGKNPKPEEEPHRALIWCALLEGVRRADRSAATLLQDSFSHFHLIGWNHLYYHVYKDITPDVPWVDAVIHKHGPTEQDMAEAHSWNMWLHHFTLTFADHVPLVRHLLPEAVRSMANEIDRYFNNTDNLAEKVRELVKRELRPMLDNHDEVLLVAHSLGTVIAYDALWELTHVEGLKGKLDFLTIGSPMGLHYIERHLLGQNNNGQNNNGKKSYPGLIRRWVNISAEGDVVAFNQQFNECFHEMLELGLVDSIEDHCHGIYNFFRSDAGLNCHRSYGYLVNPAVGSIIADWWAH
jgi:hypothetical protein